VRVLPILLGAVMVVVAGPAPAAPAAPPAVAKAPNKSGTLAAGGGLLAVGARLDGAARKLFLRACSALPCEPANQPAASPGSSGVAIELEGALDVSGARFDAVAIGGGRQVMRVVVASQTKPGVAWEALIAGRDGEARVLFSGATGFGGTGEGAGHRIVIEGHSPADVYVGKLRRELTVCGQEETLLEPRRLDGKTLDLRRVAMHRIPASVRNAATTLVASATTTTPIGSLLTVRGGSVHDGASTALADGDDDTAWTETVKGDGKGEFVVFSVPKAMAFDRLSLLLTPKTKVPTGYTPPTSLWLSVDDATYRIAIPPTSESRVEVMLPKAINTQCLTLSIDKAEGKDPTVGLAEVDAVPVLPSTVHDLADLVTLLDSPDSNGDLAQTVLGNAGSRGAAVIAKKLATLGNAGRLRALEVLDEAPCESAAYPLATMSYDAPKAVAARAREILDHCGGAATKAIAETYATGGDAAREVLAERWVKLDAKSAVPAILETVRKAPAKRRYTFRNALARAATLTVGRDAIATWLATAPANVAPGETDPVVELARAIAPVAELTQQLAAQLAKALLNHASDGRSFDAQWLAAEPLAALGARGDLAALARLRTLHKSKDRYLRARAVEVSGDVEPLRPEVVAALHDPDARVRRTALIALRRGSGPTGATGPTMQLLREDAWTYVRVAAAETLGESKGGGDVDVALGDATRDDLPAVRSAAIRALSTRGARSQLPAIRKRAFAPTELVEVRAEAIGALGALCDKASVDELFDIAKRGSSNEGAHQMALAAVAALGEIHPVDLAQRLSALDQTSLVMKDAIRRALKTQPSCK